MTKVFILALDGLEYQSVKNWKLKHLMQRKFGTFPTLINKDMRVPLSPQVWGSFITGREQKIGSWLVYNRLLEFLSKQIPLRWIKGKRKLASKLQISHSYVGRSNIEGMPLFDVIPKSIAVEVPTYNLNAPELLGLVKTKLDEGLNAFENACMNRFEKTVNRIFESIEDDWDIFMAWITIADTLAHSFIRIEAKMKAIYQKLNLLAYNISRKIPEEAWLLIVSDHGMQLMPDGTGQHTNYGFYSLNHETAWNPTGITDFYKFIINEINTQIS
ncbi:MAG: hypothetical protein JSV35_07715 [Candidatus Bathyarchaeota archaeon]|nr:MAG: hypothetical protein JSV35_07715 [Candidatus Bathyarchaeota archaeon]